MRYTHVDCIYLRRLKIWGLMETLFVYFQIIIIKVNYNFDKKHTRFQVWYTSSAKFNQIVTIIYKNIEIKPKWGHLLSSIGMFHVKKSPSKCRLWPKTQAINRSLQWRRGNSAITVMRHRQIVIITTIIVADSRPTTTADHVQLEDVRQHQQKHRSQLNQWQHKWQLPQIIRSNSKVNWIV